MAEIGEPLKRRILVPDDLPVEAPAPAVKPPEQEPAKVEPEEVPA